MSGGKTDSTSVPGRKTTNKDGNPEQAREDGLYKKGAGNVPPEDE